MFEAVKADAWPGVEVTEEQAAVIQERALVTVRKFWYAALDAQCAVHRGTLARTRCEQFIGSDMIELSQNMLHDVHELADALHLPPTEVRTLYLARLIGL